MAKIETAIQIFGNAIDKLNSIAFAASSTAEIIEAIPGGINITAGNSINEMAFIRDTASSVSDEIGIIPDDIGINVGNTIDELTAMHDAAAAVSGKIDTLPKDIAINAGSSINELAAVHDAAAAASNEINTIPENFDINADIDINGEQSISELESIHSTIDGIVERFADLRESASFIEFNEIEKLTLMDRELTNNQNRLTLLTSTLTATKQKWDEVAASAGKNSSEALKLYGEYLKVDKQVNTLEKSNLRIVNQIDEQVALLESMRFPIEPIVKEENALERVTYELDEQKNKQNQFNRQLKDATYHADNLGNKISGYIKSFIGLQAVKKGLEGTVGAAAQLSQKIQMMQGFFGNADVGAAYFTQLQDYAYKTGRSIDDLSAITQQLIGFTKNTDRLMDFNRVAEKLTLKNPLQGLDDAGYAISEALSGQFTSLKNRFNLSSVQLEPIKKAVEDGNLEGITKAFDDALNMAGITDGIVDMYKQTVPNRIEGITNTIKGKFAETGMAALNYLEPVLIRISDWLNSDGGARFFDNIAMGVNFITLVLTGLFDLITSNWDTVKLILMGAAVVLGILAGKAVAAGAASVMSAAASGLAWAAAHWPVLLLIAVVGFLIAKFIEAGGKIEEVIGFVGGILGVFWAFLYNQIAYVWNAIVSLAEFFSNVFIDPVYAVKKLFYDLTINVLTFFQGMINGVLDGLNWLIDKMNSVIGTDFERIEVTLLDEVIADLTANKPTSDKDVKDFSDKKMDFKDYTESWDSGYDKGSKLWGQVTDVFDGLNSSLSNLDTYNGTQSDYLSSIDDNTKKIKDSVDLSEEDLKYLKDIAEREAINQFTTRMIVPQSSINIENVNGIDDVNKLYGRITEMLQDELSVMSEGVHE